MSDRGIAKSAKGDYDGAIADYTLAIETAPNFAPPWNNRGIALRAIGDFAGAMENHSRAIQLDPKLASAWNNRSLARIDLGDIDGAISDSSRALEVDPRYVNALSSRGSARLAKYELDAALEDFNRALAIDSQSANALNNRGLTRAERGEFEDAITDFTRAAESDAKSAAAWNNRGLAIADRGDNDAAIADFTRAFSLRPGALSLFARANALWRQGKREAASADYRRIAEFAAAEPEPYIWVSLYFNQNEAAQRAAAAMLDRSLKRSAKPEGWNVLLGWLGHRKAGQPREAINFLDQWAPRIDPNRWPVAIVRHLKGEIPREALLAAAKTLGQQTEARAIIGMNLLYSGDSPGGMSELRWVRDAGRKSRWAHALALMEVERREGIAPSLAGRTPNFIKFIGRNDRLARESGRIL